MSGAVPANPSVDDIDRSVWAKYDIQQRVGKGVSRKKRNGRSRETREERRRRRRRGQCRKTGAGGAETEKKGRLAKRDLSTSTWIEPPD